MTTGQSAERLVALLGRAVQNEDIRWLVRTDGYLQALREAVASRADDLLEPERHSALLTALDDRSEMRLNDWPSRRAEGLLIAAQAAAAQRDRQPVDQAVIRGAVERLQPPGLAWVPPSDLGVGSFSHDTQTHSQPGLVAFGDLLRLFKPGADVEPVSRSVTINVLISRHRHGEAAQLRVRTDPHGPQGAFLDIGATPFTRFDRDFAEAIEAARLSLGPSASGLSIRWSLQRPGINGDPYDELTGPSIGLAAAVAMLLLIERKGRKIAQHAYITGAVDAAGNACSLLKDHGQIAVYERKLEAAGAGLVIYPAVDAPAVEPRARMLGLPPALEPVPSARHALRSLTNERTGVRARRRAITAGIVCGVLTAVAAAILSTTSPSAPVPPEPLDVLRAEVQARVLQITTPTDLLQPDGQPALDASFGILRTEVERSWFARCIEITEACRRTDGSSYAVESVNQAAPATGVNAAEARSFCELVGGRLPRLEEWQAAARTVGANEWPLSDFRGQAVPQILTLPPGDPFPLRSLQNVAQDLIPRDVGEAVFLVRHAREWTSTTCQQECVPWLDLRVPPPSLRVVGLSPVAYTQALAAGRLSRFWWDGLETTTSRQFDDVAFRCAFDLPLSNTGGI